MKLTKFALGLVATAVLAGCSTSTSVATQSDKLIIAHRGASGYLPEHTLESKALAFGQQARATAYVVHFSTYTPSNSSSRNSSDQPAAVNFPFILCFFGCNR
ncbi:hypothetical protein NUS47_04025, partial [Glaesserella parasuis]|nr:hypothetical protein [Glaesserella parasuis]